MSRYDFVSPGAAAGDALRQLMVQRETQRRQEMIDGITQRRETQQEQQDQQQAALGRAQLASVDDQRKATAALDAQTLADKQRAAFTATHSVGDTIGADDAAKYPGLISPGMPSQGAHLGTDASGVDQYDVAPGLPAYKGTPEQQDKKHREEYLGQLLARPNLTDSQRNGLLWAQASNDHTGVAALFKDDHEDVYRQSPRTGEIEHVGTVPKGSHFMSEPPPKVADAPEPVGVETDARSLPWMTGADGKPARYVDLSQYVGKDRTQARREAHAAGVLALNKDDAAALVEADGALSNLDYVEQSIVSKLPKDSTGRIAGGAVANKLAQYFQTDDQLSASGALRAAAIKSLRAAAGSKGLRINEAEINLAVENDLPKITDTVGVARQKINNMRTLIKNGARANLGMAAASPTVTLRDPKSGATRTVQRDSDQYRAYIAAGAVEGN